MFILLIQYQKLKADALCPKQGSDFSAGYDLYACLEEQDVVIEPHKTVMVGTV